LVIVKLAATGVTPSTLRSSSAPAPVMSCTSVGRRILALFSSFFCCASVPGARGALSNWARGRSAGL
jgi:hypothetical protein